jgi:hypothetical protein
MKINEIITESFGANPYSKTTLPLSDFRGLHNPLDADNSDTMDASILWDKVDEMIEAGVEPHVMPVKIHSMYATQDWLSSEPGDEALFDTYTEYPVVLKYMGVNYILDGHNRIAKALRQGKSQINVYLFGLQ